MSTLACVNRSLSVKACQPPCRNRPKMRADLEAYSKSAVNAAREAGSVIAASFNRKDKGVQFKGAVDLVTETDKACEQLIYTNLHRAYPEHKFIGEEGSSVQGCIDALTDEPTWMCDPLDGTTNFVHGFPSCCVSLALAIKKQVEDLGDALFCSEIGVSRDKDTMTAIFTRIQTLTQQTRSMRAQGSCALDMCAAACGRVDFMYEIGFGGCWDCAAGALIVEEAGGLVLDPSGGPFNLMSRRVLAGNKLVTKKAASLIAQQPLGPNEPPPLPL